MPLFPKTTEAVDERQAEIDRLKPLIAEKARQEARQEYLENMTPIQRAGYQKQQSLLALREELADLEGRGDARASQVRDAIARCEAMSDSDPGWPANQGGTVVMGDTAAAAIAEEVRKQLTAAKDSEKAYGAVKDTSI